MVGDLWGPTRTRTVLVVSVEGRRVFLTGVVVPVVTGLTKTCVVNPLVEVLIVLVPLLFFP